MKRITLFTIIFISFACFCIGQVNEKQKSSGSESVSKEAEYYAPIRYVIVYDWIFDAQNERRVEILLSESQFAEKNLRQVFEMIKQRFPSPTKLEIEVHTSLKTIETPEEREMLRDSDDKRFSAVRFNYKTASFSRFDSGREAFVYTTNLSPYKKKLVIIKK